MIKAGIDQGAMVKMFTDATAKQGETLRKAVAEATLKALQGRELTMENVRKVLKSVTQAASAGAQNNALPGVDVEELLEKAFTGMDGALLKAVEAQRKALQQFVEQGMAVQDKPMKTALANLEQMEDMFFTTVGKAAKDAGGALQAPWQQVLETMKLQGTGTGTQAVTSVEQLLAQAQSTLREGRSTGMRQAQAMLESYAALVSGVLIGMSEGLQPAAPAAKKPAKAPAR